MGFGRIRMEKPMSRYIGTGTFQTTERVRELVNRVLDTERISYGELSKKFEKDFSKRHGAKYGIISNSGTSALQVALAALSWRHRHEWKRGDEVIVPATTFVATPNIVRMMDMTPVFVDVELSTYNINPDLIADAISDRTRAIIPVHLFGQSANMIEILQIVREKGLYVIEDSCETMFAEHFGQTVGSFGDIACFSTYMAHLITTGVGGVSITNDAELAATMRSLVNHGLTIENLSPDDNFSPRPMLGRRFEFDKLGYSYRITEFEAALGIAGLEDEVYILTKRRKNAKILTAELNGINKKYGDVMTLPRKREYNTHAWMMYPIVLNKKGVKERLTKWLNARQIETRDMLPILGQPVYRHLNPEKYPVSKKLVEDGFYIGCHQGLMEDDLNYALDAFWDFFNKEYDNGNKP